MSLTAFQTLGRDLFQRQPVETKVIGGHPILVTAPVHAVKNGSSTLAGADITGTLEIKFDPGD
jgi:hypothetical protein